MATASRLTNTGTLLVNGIFDEVTNAGNTSFATRTDSTGTVYTTNSTSGFDEVSYSLNGATGAYTYNNGVSTATNKYSYSQNFSQSFWVPATSTFTQNTVTSPDGSLTGATWTGSSASIPYFAGTTSITTGLSYTFSIYVKAGTQTRAGILLYSTHFNSGGANGFPVWDLSTGTLVTAPPAFITAYGIQAVGNGWYRLYVTSTATTTNGSIFTQLVRMQDATYVAGNYLCVWGA